MIFSNDEVNVNVSIDGGDDDENNLLLTIIYHEIAPPKTLRYERNIFNLYFRSKRKNKLWEIFRFAFRFFWMKWIKYWERTNITQAES